MTWVYLLLQFDWLAYLCSAIHQRKATLMRLNSRFGSGSSKFFPFFQHKVHSIGVSAAIASLFLCASGLAGPPHQSPDAQSAAPRAQSTPHSFYGRIVNQNGVRYILRDDENSVWYHLDDQDKAAKLFGKAVLVTGTYDGVSGAIHVQNIVEARPEDRPRPVNDEKKPDPDPPKMRETPPATVDANAAAAPQAVPPPPLVLTARTPPSDDPPPAESRAPRRSASEGTASPAPEPPEASLISLPEEPVTASSSVAVSSRRFIPMSADSTPESQPSENLRIGKLLRCITPAYPPDARQQHLEGTVRLRAVISEDGAVESLEPVSGPPLLVEAAVAAVRDWRYSPTFLDGQRVQTQAEISLVYRLPQ
jgi:protein TonB